MRSSIFIVAAVGILLVADCTIPMAGAAPSIGTPPSAGKYGATESRIFDLINAQRQHQGLRPLVYNPQLDRMAKIQAENMARYQKMAHVIPDASLPTLGQIIRDQLALAESAVEIDRELDEDYQKTLW